jgi:peroxiredoxin
MEFCGKIPAAYIKVLQKRSLRKGVKYDLDAEYLNELLESQNMKCALSGIPLTIRKESCEKSTASLDRIIPELGYTKGNVQWVHKDINYMKGRFSEDRFIQICRIVSEYRPLSLKEAVGFAKGD